MSYCSNCGEKLPKGAYFCPKCGTKSALGAETNVNGPPPSEEMKQAFAKMSTEIEKAFAIAAKEIQEAFQTARENIQESTQKDSLTCSNCGQTNQGGSAYCYKCGNKLELKDKEKST